MKLRWELANEGLMRGDEMVSDVEPQVWPDDEEDDNGEDDDDYDEKTRRPTKWLNRWEVVAVKKA